MSEHPILFSGPDVCAIIEGRKTQTRRLVTHRHGIHFLGGQGERDDPSCWGWSFDGPDHSGYMVLERGLNQRHDHGLVSMPCPYGKPGDRMWVRETWGLAAHTDPTDWHRGSIAGVSAGEILERWRVEYRADWQTDGDACYWRPSMFMPRWASRITLRVTNVRVQRLQEISEEDARAEGCKADDAFILYQADQDGTLRTSEMQRTARGAFAVRWDAINGKRRVRVPMGYPDFNRFTSEVDTSSAWASNPWVWAISFERTS